MSAKEFTSYVMEQYPGGIYILDHERRYVYANATYMDMLSLSYAELMMHEVHELMSNGNYDICISDIVFAQRHAVSVFSNVYANVGGVLKRKRHLVRAIPVFDEAGEIVYMLAFCDAVDYLNGCYYEANSRKMADLENTFYRRDEKQHDEQLHFVAESPAMQNVLEDAKKIAAADATVLITGASGTGKELVAEYIHRRSQRGKHCMVVVNCAALPENLLESNLYGYERGAFTGALTGGKKGLIEAADKGTLFLDEINSLPLELQGKLLRTLETKKIQRVGATEERSVDFRLLAATNRDLYAIVQNGEFREDLYYRLNIIPIRLPTLVERKEDILPLARYFSKHYGEKYHKDMVLSEKAMVQLVEYTWPGNVRELRNVVERMVIMISGEYVTAADICRIIGTTEQRGTIGLNGFDLARLPLETAPVGKSLREFTEQAEWAYIQQTLRRCGGNVNDAAKRLGIHRSVLYRKIKKYQEHEM